MVILMRMSICTSLLVLDARGRHECANWIISIWSQIYRLPNNGLQIFFSSFRCMIQAIKSILLIVRLIPRTWIYHPRLHRWQYDIILTSNNLEKIKEENSSNLKPWEPEVLLGRRGYFLTKRDFFYITMQICTWNFWRHMVFGIKGWWR